MGVLIETKRAFYSVTPSVENPKNIFNVIRVSKKNSKKRVFQAWYHQVEYWKRKQI